MECALRGGEPAEALEHVRRLAALDPYDRGVQGLSRALDAGVTGRVATDGGGVWPLLVDDTYATVAFGDLCLAQGLTDEATAVFSRIVVRQPDHETARARLSELGRPKGAARRPRG